jgi:predicted acyl esterase
MNTWDGYRGEQRGWFGQWDHVRGNESELVGREGFLEEAMAFFDHHLKGGPKPHYPGNVEVQDGEGRWRTEAAWPPADADYNSGSIPVKPGSYPDDAGDTGTWTFTPPAPYDLRFAGTPVLDVNVGTTVPNANLIALIYDVPPKGDATLVTRGAYLVEEPGRVTFELFPQDWILRRDHRFGLMLVSSESWFNPIPTGQTVTIEKGGELELPFLRYERTPNLKGGRAEAQKHTPHRAIDRKTITQNTVKAKFPPKPRPSKR